MSRSGADSAAANNPGMWSGRGERTRPNHPIPDRTIPAPPPNQPNHTHSIIATYKSQLTKTPTHSTYSQWLSSTASTACSTTSACSRTATGGASGLRPRRASTCSPRTSSA